MLHEGVIYRHIILTDPPAVGATIWVVYDPAPRRSSPLTSRIKSRVIANCRKRYRGRFYCCFDRIRPNEQGSGKGHAQIYTKSAPGSVRKSLPATFRGSGDP